MEYNRELHSMECPSCGHGLDEISYPGDLLIDRCTNCGGLWFDQAESDLLKSKWLTEALAVGKSAKGMQWDAHDRIACPHCGENMERAADPDQPHVWYEVCKTHGIFLDTTKFADLKQQTLSDWFISLIKVTN
jgi:Zn-finger nucleic acid-binding protein